MWTCQVTWNNIFKWRLSFVWVVCNYIIIHDIYDAYTDIKAVMLLMWMKVLECANTKTKKIFLPGSGSRQEFLECLHESVHVSQRESTLLNPAQICHFSSGVDWIGLDHTRPNWTRLDVLNQLDLASPELIHQTGLDWTELDPINRTKREVFESLTNHHTVTCQGCQLPWQWLYLFSHQTTLTSQNERSFQIHQSKKATSGAFLITPPHPQNTHPPNSGVSWLQTAFQPWKTSIRLGEWNHPHIQLNDHFIQYEEVKWGAHLASWLP